MRNFDPRTDKEQAQDVEELLKSILKELKLINITLKWLLFIVAIIVGILIGR